MVTARQATLVQQTWQNVQPIAAKAAELFYARLFQLDPSLRSLFTGDMAEQGEKLMKTLNAAVNALGDLPALVPTLEALARRHVAYGVQPEHYDTVGQAWLWTLERGLGSDFTPEVRDAWAAVYATVSQVMLDAVE